MSSYQHVLNLAESRGKAVPSKRVANNTYAVRLSDDGPAGGPPRFREVYDGESGLKDPPAVGIKLHNTIVVTYTKTGELILSTGGWHTVTTKDRINSYTPNWIRVFSEKGEWRVQYRPFGDDVPSVPYTDGVTFEINSLAGTAWTPVPGTYPDESQERLAREARKKLKADVDAYLKKTQPSLANWKQQLDGGEGLNVSGDCWYCLGLVSNFDGSPANSNDHLWQHLRDSYVFPSLFVVAYADRGFRDPRAAFAMDVSFSSSRATETLKKFLLKRLGASVEPQANNSLLVTYVEQAREVLEKPDDFGYFGSDTHLWKKSAPTWTKTRDSSNLELANFQIVWDALKAEFPELFPESLDEDGYPDRNFDDWPAIYVFGAGHWAVGHIDQIVVPVKIDGRRPVAVDNLHPAFIRICEFLQQVKAYPALDGAEEIADSLTVEQIKKGVQQYVDYLDDARVTPYLDQIQQWWITREVLEGEEEFGYWTDDILKAHAGLTEEEAHAEHAVRFPAQADALF